MAEIKHEDIVRAVRLAADIENAAMTIAQQEILINRLSAELKEAQSIAEQMLDIVLEKQKAEKAQEESEVRITRESECVEVLAERFANEAVLKIENMKIKVCRRAKTEVHLRVIYAMAADICIRVIKEVLRDFLNEKTAVKK